MMGDATRGNAIVVVSGLPRCGTSMMMRMLEAGGLPVLTDGVRPPDEDNPHGYYEFEPVKQLAQDQSWVPGARGRAVKMVSALLPELPSQYLYRVVFMEREIQEVLSSQGAMLGRQGKVDDPRPSSERAAAFEGHVRSLMGWMDRQANFSLLRVSYNHVLAAPRDEAARVNRFLGGDLDVAAMAAVVEPSLYRQRA